MPEPITNPSDIRLNERNDLEALIGSPPGWSLRWGLTVLLLAVVGLLVIGWWVRYPDVVEARAVLTTQNPPIRLAAGASAKINVLKVANGQPVQAGDLLAVLDNPARLEDVQQLDVFLRKMAENSGDIGSAQLPETLQLGSLQGAFATFSQRFQDLQYFLQQDINYLKTSNLRSQITEIEHINQSLQRQEKIMVEEVALARRNMERDSTLLVRNSVSRLEFEQSQSAYLARRRELEALRSGTSQNQLRVREIQGRILDLQQLRSDDESDKLTAFRADLQRLQGELEVWKKTWLLTAPIGGEVALTQAWSEQQFVKEGEEVLTIVPQEASGRIVAKAVLSNASAGKVRPEMPAHLRLDGFPYQEFGVLNGRVGRIASVPGEQGYELEILLPEKLVTSYGRPVDFRQEMQATARIVTEERSLLQRIFEKILAAFEEN
ncbi:MAG: HlyD family efflux transporter periplasmic adaptor subunit [Bacteroidetes bacterium]|nr:HlyD family efflux transporter periplasmic adaptor subunit [Bacteroidota bacterium]